MVPHDEGRTKARGALELADTVFEVLLGLAEARLVTQATVTAASV